ncbi:MAG TPA: leucine--tRNA ligase [Candidatus Parcubacteria bacterium]|nr:leucine--tRNA ligase [Candidatus Parcubacteria bacterium]
MKYNHKKIEKKWQKIWQKENFFQALDSSRKEKLYLLVEFPYPSGEGLHVGHCRSYVGMDVVARKKRMDGFNVLFPMGWDAFGLPTENYAIKTGISPVEVTKKNTAKFKQQYGALGLSFDWNREINTTDPSYYKWTQWIFLQLYKHDLAYKTKISINWCPSCKIGLANEEVVNGKCERCGTEVIRREKEQWMLRITKYADRLIKDLDLVDYPEPVKTSQKEWIGKSKGAVIKFPINGIHGLSVEVFTTRPDTLFGCTYLVLAPEHPLVDSLIKKENDSLKIGNYVEVKNYVNRSKKKAERERLAEKKEKSGVMLDGIKAINPVNKKEIPVFVADYVLMNYGTGAIMAVPAHDQRDFNFAKKHGLSIIEVIREKGKKISKLEEEDFWRAYEGEGVLVNSGRFNGLNSRTAKKRITERLKRKGFAREAVYYKLRDWVFSRQRYWGEPIPVVYCRQCWKDFKARNPQAELRKGIDYVVIDGKEYMVNLVPENDLPVKLPKIDDYKPGESGESPLAKVEGWVNVRCPKCGSFARRETDVMPNWAGSNWYYLRYCDPQNEKKMADKKLLEYWMPVDWYDGGAEHITLHLLYSRFIYKFLWDIGAVPKSVGPEPYKKRTSHGLVLAEGGVKMSKSKGNVVNPDDIIKEYGADTLRTYEMFMGPFEQAIPWDTKGVKGARRFLEKVWVLANKWIKNNKNTKSAQKRGSKELKAVLHKIVKKVSEDIDLLKFNTAISSLMEFSNAWLKDPDGLSERDFRDFLKILSPFAPHLSEEIWAAAGFKGICSAQKWPKYKEDLIKEKIVNLVIQINGKVRDKVEVRADIDEKEAKNIALSRGKVKKWTEGKKVKLVIFVPGKLINIVVK